MFARLGGEEFIVVLPDIEPADAHRMAERIREQAMSLELDADRAAIGVTCSLGVVHATGTPPNVQSLINIADEALYEAKRLGRNRTEVRSLAA
ncbi:MAG: GGDEF domain-containing protein [Luteimonas sp.]|nr:GGDEF domain-containing protein [Luteimonas sp.]